MTREHYRPVMPGPQWHKDEGNRTALLCFLAFLCVTVLWPLACALKP